MVGGVLAGGEGVEGVFLEEVVERRGKGSLGVVGRDGGVECGGGGHGELAGEAVVLVLPEGKSRGGGCCGLVEGFEGVV